MIPFFDDAGSFAHAALGALAVARPEYAAAICAGFLFYQMREVEPLANKFGDFAEFAAGACAGKALCS